MKSDVAAIDNPPTHQNSRTRTLTEVECQEATP
jgi:hypothetical protein